MSDEANSSRVEDILENINGESHELEKPRSRIEEILTNILNGSSIFGKAQSRVEDLLIELADIIESGGSLTDLDNIAFGNNPTVPEEGKITSENLEDIADAINEVASRPIITVGELEEPITENGTYAAPQGEAWNEVTVDVESAEPSLESLYVDSNGTYTPADCDGFNEVIVDVESAEPSLQPLVVTENGSYYPDPGYDGFDEVRVDLDLGFVDGLAISGTLDNPFDTYQFSVIHGMLNVLWNTINARPVMAIDATKLGLGTGNIMLFPQTDNGDDYIIGTGGFVDKSSSMAVSVIWGPKGLVSAYIEQNGSIVDMSSYASSIDTVVYSPTKG